MYLCHCLLCFFIPTYTANGQGEAHSVKHCGGDCAVVERVLDAFVVTEKAPLVGADLTQVKGRQRQTSCGRRSGRSGVKRDTAREKVRVLKEKGWGPQVCHLSRGSDWWLSKVRNGRKTQTCAKHRLFFFKKSWWQKWGTSTFLTVDLQDKTGLILVDKRSLYRRHWNKKV